MGVRQTGWNPHTGRTETWLLEDGQMHPPPRPYFRPKPEPFAAQFLSAICRMFIDMSVATRRGGELIARAMEWLAELNERFWRGVAERIGAGRGRRSPTSRRMG